MDDMLNTRGTCRRWRLEQGENIAKFDQIKDEVRDHWAGDISSIMQLSHTKDYPYQGLIFVKGKFRAKIDRLLAQEVRDYWI